MTNCIVSAIAAVLLLLGPTFADTSVQWPDLIDQSAQSFDDPFRDLTYDEIEALQTVVITRSRLENANLADSDRADLEAKLSGALATLATRDIDADWLIAQRWVVAERREAAATAGNPAIDGRTVTLAGFAIPAAPDPDGTAVAFLVPERGMCSHMPPPNPNQMLRVRLTDDWQPKTLHEPVRLTGKLSIAPSETAMHIVDGVVPMKASFLMEAERVETLQDRRFGRVPAVSDEMAQSIAERVRASGAKANSKTVVSE
ncbi:MAG: DUF3299 domain-containing protein [Paracoccaceae bacterium]|nr:DUF3299 domain-containing protein [Paracoccaceae bacterium]